MYVMDVYSRGARLVSRVINRSQAVHPQRVLREATAPGSGEISMNNRPLRNKALTMTEVGNNQGYLALLRRAFE